MRGTGPFATLRINLFWRQHVGLDHPSPPPFSQEKGERERNVGSRNGLLALETLRNWLCKQYFQLILEDYTILVGNRLAI